MCSGQGCRVADVGIKKQQRQQLTAARELSRARADEHKFRQQTSSRNSIAKRALQRTSWALCGRAPHPQGTACPRFCGRLPSCKPVAQEAGQTEFRFKRTVHGCGARCCNTPACMPVAWEARRWEARFMAAALTAAAMEPPCCRGAPASLQQTSASTTCFMSCVCSHAAHRLLTNVSPDACNQTNAAQAHLLHVVLVLPCKALPMPASSKSVT